MHFEKFQKIYRKYRLQIWLIAIFVPIILITLGCIFFQDLFWEKFIWKYYFGPIEADASDKVIEGIKPGYNTVNTITYGLILTLFIFGIYKLLLELEIKVDLKFFLGVLPFIILGSISRVLEDSKLFKKPFIYLFISPIIYFLIALVTIIFLILSKYIEKVWKNKGEKQVYIILALIILSLDFAYIFVYFFGSKYFTFLINPIWLILITNAIFGLVLLYLKKDFTSSSMLFATGIIFLFLGISYIGYWLFIKEWSAGKGKNLEVLPVIIFLSFFLTLFYISIAKILSKKYKAIGIFLIGVNIAIVYAHFLDASATFIGVDFYGYYEKHVLPKFLISIFHTASIMFLLKAVVIGLVIYLIDIVYKKELEKKQTLVGLVKLFVFVLGFAPGVRDLIRLAMGV